MKPVVLFDAGRLLDRTARGAPTGVDRVCLAYADWLAGRRDIRVVPVATLGNRLRTIDPARYRRELKALKARWAGGGPADDREHALERALAAGPGGSSILDAETPPASLSARRARAVGQALASRPLPVPSPGETYISVGHTGLNTPAILTGLARRGVPATVMIHDLIPVTHPEFCRPGDDERHRQRLRTALAHADRIIVNSRYTADQLRAFAADARLRQPRAAHRQCPPLRCAGGGGDQPLHDRY